MFKKILSLDVSTTCTGYTFFDVDFENKIYKHIETSSIKAKNSSLYTRFNTIHSSFTELGLYTNCDFVIFENYAFNGNRITQLAELNGLLKYNYHQHNKDIEVIASTTVKKWITGVGRGPKENIRISLNNISDFKDITFANNDESDSCAVGLAYILKRFEEGDNVKPIVKKGKKRKST